MYNANAADRGDVAWLEPRRGNPWRIVGIHNAWDAVTYHVFVQRREERKDHPNPDWQRSASDANDKTTS